jgi:hypothetical protein
MQLVFVAGLILCIAKLMVSITGEELIPLDWICAVIGILMLFSSFLEFLYHGGGKRKFNSDFLSPGLFVLGLMLLGVSSVSNATDELPYLLVNGTNEVKEDYLFRYPGQEVFHYSQNPIEGKIRYETRVVRNDLESDRKPRSILVLAQTILSYHRGEHKAREQFPEDWEFNDVIRDALTAAPEQIPGGKDYDEYEGEEFRRIFLENFRKDASTNGYLRSTLSYDLKLGIISVSAEPIKNYPVSEGWFHASCPVSNFSKESNRCTAHLLHCLWSSLLSGLQINQNTNTQTNQ